MGRELRAGAIAGAVAPFVFLLGVVGICWLQKDFMERFGWDRIPSGLALGPDGWLQIVNFILFGVLLLAYARAVSAVPARDRWDRAAHLLVGLAGVAAVMLAFKDDADGETTWQGAVHAGAYLAWLPSIVISYPLTWRRLRARPAWRAAPVWVSAVALLLPASALLLPDSEAASNYLFFAVVLMPLVALATRLAAAALSR
jgi:uncharacterized membrane protein YuzA (DUF378 family)